MIGQLVAVGSLLPFIIIIIIHASSLNLCMCPPLAKRDLHMKPRKFNSTQKEFGEAISPYLAIY
jgi:hypothetical protein